MRRPSTNTGRRWDFEPLTPVEFSHLLSETDISVQSFCRLTGSNPKRVLQWLSGESPDMPFWVGSFLEALMVPEAAERAWRFAQARTRFREREDKEDGEAPPV